VGLREDLGPGPTALDTVVFIYYIEENQDFLRRTRSSSRPPFPPAVAAS
jgi:hypothetical protein